MSSILNHYLKEVLGVRSVILPLKNMTNTSVETTSNKPQLWIAIDQSLGEKELDLLDRMLKSVHLELKDFKTLLTDEIAAADIKVQDFVLWFSDKTWSYQNANVAPIYAFNHFFELEGDKLKDLKKSTWEKLKVFAKQLT